MKKIKAGLLLTLLLAALVFASIAVAQKGRRHHAPRMRMEMKMVAAELDLTDEQKATLKEMKFDAQKKAIAVRSKIKVAELELRQLMDDDNADEGKIKKKIEDIGKLRTDMRIAQVQKRLSMKNVLTAEQREKAKSLMQERKKRRMQMEDRGQNRRPGMQMERYRRFQQQRQGFVPEHFDEFDEIPEEEISSL